MYKMALLPLVLLMGGCAGHDTAMVATPGLTLAAVLPPQGAINYLAERIVNDLVLHNTGLGQDQPLLVTTPVMVDDLMQTNALALQLQQGFVGALQQREFSLVDQNVAQMLSVTPQGDFILSRDWQKLPQDLQVEHLLVTTLSAAVNGMVINSRIVELGTGRVLSSSQSFVSQAELPDYLQPAERVVSRQGLLYLNAAAAQGMVTVTGEVQ
ncbi:FlgO family outer membrane protein [Shewanella salipaludis]|uniref:FlgO domain-containing protein n=1 Tax=Shewanella salipaludis TaxID=2723052 RepID=A0A972JIX0_9GAMM|nr:FlgO family outer membrane protein [Shewanella salipaludis]NMH65528.1 hypothetical protein [Shewanella salipaludis]